MKLKIDDIVMCDTSGKRSIDDNIRRIFPSFRRNRIIEDRMQGVIIDIPSGALIKYIVDIGKPFGVLGFHDWQLTEIGRL